MKPRHAAALALVGWYLMAPPLKCMDKSRQNDPSCDMHYDGTADLREWQEGHRFPTAEACNAAIVRARKYDVPDLERGRYEQLMKCAPRKEVRKARQVRRAKLRTPVLDSDEPLHPRIIPSD